MLKKLLACVCALIICGSAYANNFYVGVGAGLSTYLPKEVGYFGSPTTNHQETHPFGAVGFIGGGFVGYQFKFHSRFDLGLEAFVNGNTAKAKAQHDFNGTRLQIDSNWNWGVRVLPGYEFTDRVEGHIIAGYTQGHYSIKDNGLYTTGTVGQEFSGDFSKSGYQVGLGTTIGLSHHFSLRLDAIYSGYSSKHLSISGPTGSTPTPYHIKTQAFDGTVSLLYNF